MTLLLSESEVKSILTMPLALEAVENSFQRLADGSALLHSRARLHIPDALQAGENHAVEHRAAAGKHADHRIRMLAVVHAALFHAVRAGECGAHAEAGAFRNVGPGGNGYGRPRIIALARCPSI